MLSVKSRPRKPARAIFILAAFILLVCALPHADALGEVYSLTALPSYSQEGSTITMVLNVSQASPLTSYAFTFHVLDPSNAIFTSNPQSHATGLGQTTFNVVVSYPGPDFPGSASTSLVGTYGVSADQSKPIASSNVARSSFRIGLTDKESYQRTQTVSIIASGYSPGTTASVAIRTSISSQQVYSHTTSVTNTGYVVDSWQVPVNSTTAESYIVSVSGNPVKIVADSQTFDVQSAPVTIASLSPAKSNYQRTETLAFSFQPSYPNGQIASTGLGIIKLTSPGGTGMTITASYNSTTQTFIAYYKTGSGNETGTWTATLSSNSYGDGYGNFGPTGTINTSTQLGIATFTVTMTVKSSFQYNEPIRFNSTITYPDHSALQSGNVNSSLVVLGGGYTANVPVVYDPGLGLWVGTYSPQGNEPSGLWSLILDAQDIASPANNGSITRIVQIQDRPPIAVADSSTNNVLTGVTILFNSTGTYDPDGTIQTYLWNFGDGSTGSGPSSSQVFTIAGNYAVSLTVTDNSGSTATATLSIIIQDRPPSASISGSQLNIVTGSTVSFDASGSLDPDGLVTSYRWDFGDGASGNGVTTEHIYTNPGNYTVSLTVTDNSGLVATASSAVTVRAGSAAGLPTSYFAILGGALAASVAASLFLLRRRKTTHTSLKVDLDAVHTEAGKIVDQEFFQSVKEQLKKEKQN